MCAARSVTTPRAEEACLASERHRPWTGSTSPMIVSPISTLVAARHCPPRWTGGFPYNRAEHVHRYLMSWRFPQVQPCQLSLCIQFNSLMHVEKEAPKSAQLYIVNSGDEINCRLNIYEEGVCPSHPNPLVVLALTDMLDECNHHLQLYKTVRRRLQPVDESNLATQFLDHQDSTHGNRYLGLEFLKLLLLLLVN